MSQAHPFVAKMKPVWRDMDAFAHVNNAVYLTYLENAREAWWLAFAGPIDEFPFTLARIEIDFRSSATWRDLLSVRLWISRYGSSSFDFSYILDSHDGRRIAEAKSVLVMFDRATNQPTPIDPALRARLEAFEAAPPRA